MSVRVWFDGKTAQDHPASGLQIRPGVNDVAEESAVILARAGLVRAAKPAEVEAWEKAIAAEAKKVEDAKAAQADADAKAREAERTSIDEARRTLGLDVEGDTKKKAAEGQKVKA